MSFHLTIPKWGTLRMDTYEELKQVFSNGLAHSEVTIPKSAPAVDDGPFSQEIEVEFEPEEGTVLETAPKAKKKNGIAGMTPEQRRAIVGGAWAEARRYAKRTGVTVQEARTYLATKNKARKLREKKKAQAAKRKTAW